MQLGKLLVAFVVAALGDVIGHGGELLCRFVVQALALRLARPLGLRRAVVDEPIERRERLDAREREPRTLERHVAEIKPHRPRLGDLLDLVEIARSAGPVADTAAESGAGEVAAGAVEKGDTSRKALAAFERRWNKRYGRDLRLAHKINERIARWDDRKWDERLEVLKLLSPGQFVEALKTNLTGAWVLRFLVTNPRALAEAAGLI